MTATELRTLILAQPEGSPIRVAFAAGEDAACSDLLNALTQRGRVHVDDLRLYAIECGLLGAVGVALKIGDVASPESRAFYGLCVTLDRLLEQPKSINIDNQKFLAGLTTFVAVGFLTSTQRDEILAMADNREPIARVTAAEVEAARKAGE